MDEAKRVQFTTVETNQKEEKKSSPRKTFRFNLDLPSTTDTTCPEFSFTELLKNVSSDDRPSSDDPFGDDDDADRLAAIAKSFEEKYKPKMGKKKRNKEYLEDLVNLGDGYDENDTFIDNSEAYDEIVPAGLTTKLGGFYINSGKLDFKEISDDSDNDFQPQPGSAIKKKQKKRRISSDDESAQENKKVVKKKKIKDSLAVPGEVKKKKKKKLILQDGEKPALKKPNLTQDKDKAKPNKSSAVSALLKSTSPQQNGEHLQNGISSPIELDDSDDSLPKPPAPGSGEERKDSNSQADFEDSKKEFDPEKIPKLPPGLSAELEKSIDSLKNSAKESKEGKLKFFTGNVNKLLLEVEIASQQMTVGNRSSLYGHLAAFLPCSKDTLLKRAKTLRVKEMDDKIREPMQKLKDAVNKAMPAIQQKYDAELKAAQEKAAAEKATEEKEKSEENKDLAGGDKEKEKTEGVSDHEDESSRTKETDTAKKKFIAPIKRFTWDANLKSLLCDVVRVKMENYEISKTRAQTAEEYLRTFLEKEVRPIWPKGWMQSRILIRESKPAHMKWTTGQKPKKNVLVTKTPGSAPTISHVTKTANQGSAPAAVTNSKIVINASNANKTTPQVPVSAKSLVQASSQNTPVVSVKKIVPTLLDYTNESAVRDNTNNPQNSVNNVKTDNIITVNSAKSAATVTSSITINKQNNVTTSKMPEPKPAHTKPLAESWNHQVADILRQSVVNQMTKKTSPPTQQFQRQNSYENSFIAQFQNFAASQVSNKLPSPKDTGLGQSLTQQHKMGSAKQAIDLSPPKGQAKQAIDLSPPKAHSQGQMSAAQQEKFLKDAQERNIQRLLEQQIDDRKKLAAAQQLAKLISQAKPSSRNTDTSPISAGLGASKQIGKNVSLLTENVIRQHLDKHASSATSSGKTGSKQGQGDIFTSPVALAESLRKVSPQSNTVSSTSQVKPQVVRVVKGQGQTQGQVQGHGHSQPQSSSSLSAVNLMQSLFGQAQSKASSLAASYQSGSSHNASNQPRSHQQSPSGLSSQNPHRSPSWNVGGSLSQPGHNGVGDSQRRTSFDGAGDSGSPFQAAFQHHTGIPVQPRGSPEAGRYGNQMAPHTSPGSYPTHTSPHKQRSLSYGYPYSDSR